MVNNTLTSILKTYHIVIKTPLSSSLVNSILSLIGALSLKICSSRCFSIVRTALIPYRLLKLAEAQ